MLDRVADDGLAGVGFRPNHDQVFDDFELFLAVLLAVDRERACVGALAAFPLAFVADESLLMLGPRDMRLDWAGMRVLPPGGISSIVAPGGMPLGPNS